jgi:hypothetical protein
MASAAGDFRAAAMMPTALSNASPVGAHFSDAYPASMMRTSRPRQSFVVIRAANRWRVK